MAQAVKKDQLFGYFILLTVFFLLLEVSFFIQGNKAYFEDFSFVSANLHIPVSVLPGIIFFVIAQLLLHFIFSIALLFVAQLIAYLFNWHGNKKINLGICIWILGFASIFIANQYYFPNSKFSNLSSVIFFNAIFLKWIFVCFIFLDSICLLLALCGLFLYSKRYTLLIFLMFVLILFAYNRNFPIIVKANSKPNIIIVGVDSLRPDFINFFGRDIPTPFFNEFLNHSTVFSEALTPLARTFPSWTSILTGEYPKQSGIRFNLAKQDKFDKRKSLAFILQKAGYETIFATDETRFSNINKTFGFEQIISPPTGLNDFLLGTFNDFPLSNLIINTSIGKWLFPYSYANRPVYFTYDPNSFLALLKDGLNKPHTKPIFLATHFCLTHSPYLWKDFPESTSTVWERYAASVVRVDEQLNQFFVMLNQLHLLDHALVILLSDHGEALEFAGDRITEKDLYLNVNHSAIPNFYPPSVDKENVNQSAGHGTDVLGLSQYHTLFAMRLYGEKKQHYQIKKGLITLLDIKPTILNFLKMPTSDLEGKTLLPNLYNQNAFVYKPNHIFLESDYSPEAIRTVYPETRQVLLEGVALFDVDPQTAHLFVKDDMGKMIINSKQYADIFNEWELAYYPQSQSKAIPILVNLKTGEWTNNLNTPFARNSPAKLMIAALKKFYGQELKN